MFGKVSAEKAIEMAEAIGRSVAREYPGVEAEDLSSEALVVLMEKYPLLVGKDAGYIHRVLMEAATSHAAKERYEYMLGTSAYIYRPSEVRALLKEVYWSPDLWEVPSGKDDYLSATVSADTVFVSVLDIQQAWSSLKRAYTDVLTRVFRDGHEPGHSQEVTRAIDALTRQLNWRVNRGRDHEGSRTAMSNARAQYVTGENW